MYSKVVFWRRVVLGESEILAMATRITPTMEEFVRCYFNTSEGRLLLARLRLRRELSKSLGLDLWFDKIVGYLSKLMR